MIIFLHFIQNIPVQLNQQSTKWKKSYIHEIKLRCLFVYLHALISRITGWI